MTDETRLNKKTKIIPVAVIAGQAYRSAERASEAWAIWFMARMYARRTQALGYASYHDKLWYSRVQAFEDKAQRRALVIFKKYLP